MLFMYCDMSIFLEPVGTPLDFETSVAPVLQKNCIDVAFLHPPHQCHSHHFFFTQPTMTEISHFPEFHNTQSRMVREKTPQAQPEEYLVPRPHEEEKLYPAMYINFTGENYQTKCWSSWLLFVYVGPVDNYCTVAAATLIFT